MKFRELTGLTIQQAFTRFDNRNPLVYKQFRRMAFQSINKNKKKTSSKMIINVIRWHFFLKTEGDEFKINDAFTAHYARKFINEFPEYRYIFELRRLRNE